MCQTWVRLTWGMCLTPAPSTSLFLRWQEKRLCAQDHSRQVLDHLRLAVYKARTLHYHNSPVKPELSWEMRQFDWDLEKWSLNKNNLTGALWLSNVRNISWPLLRNMQKDTWLLIYRILEFILKDYIGWVYFLKMEPYEVFANGKSQSGTWTMNCWSHVYNSDSS